ncbi:FKBP-type peptidyl-prolyl cis-trans isomerase [Ekhidna sp.]|uniref:FKBP-type peptidyl-prolyl cis-trans isomerase n=1 Tax=Ekhidna sp. TaxID=2608089 RepID=UPI0032EBBCFF
MKKGLLGILVGFILLACGDGNVVVQVDPDIQRTKDSIAIAEYLYMKGFLDEEIGNTTNGVRYVILDSGSSVQAERIDESDHVDFNYIGKTLGDTIFDTSIQELGDSLKQHYEENPYITDTGDTVAVFTRLEYEPWFITYSASGWSIPTGQGGFIHGFAEGIAATFKYMGLEGKVLIVIPSGLAYGSSRAGVFIDPNTPIAFELYPIKLTKQ